MIALDSKVKHQPLPARVHFIRPWEPTDKRGVVVYTDTEVAMALQNTDHEDGLQKFNDLALQAGARVVVEGEPYIIRKVDVRLYNFDIQEFRMGYPLSFDTTDATAPYVFSVEVHLDNVAENS